MNCPRCDNTELTRTPVTKGTIWYCMSCEGKLVGVGLLRKATAPAFLSEVWRLAQEKYSDGAACPACKNKMSLVLSPTKVAVDVCTRCMMIWFDKGEVPPRITSPVEYKQAQNSPEVNRIIAQAVLDTVEEKQRWSKWEKLINFLGQDLPWYRRF